MIRRSIGLNMLLTQYLIERDCLSACMTRFGSGFFPRGEIKEARKVLENIQTLLDDFEKAATVPKDKEIVISQRKLQ